MRDEFPGFYRPGAEDVDELWRNALIVPDANVLLTIYRLAEGTRGKLLAIFESLGERLFLPHQVALEFQRNRLEVIRDQERAYERVEAQVRGFAGKVGGGMGRHPRLDREEIEAEIRQALKPVEAHLEQIRAEHPDPLQDGDLLGADSVRDEIDRIFAGKLGSPRDVAELTRLGRERFAKRLPPGFEDAGKEEPERYGDLALWLEMVGRARDEGRGAIFVTEERKADWWWKRGSETLAPRPELIEEMRREAEQRFWIYSLNRFIELAGEKLDIAISEDERDDVARAGGPVDASAAIAAAIAPMMVGAASGLASGGGIPAAASGALAAGLSGPGWQPAAWGALHKSGWLGESSLRDFSSWRTTVGADDEGVVLGISWKGREESSIDALPQTLTCSVVAPSRRRYSASQISFDGGARFVYPSDFGNPEPEAGTHVVIWSCAALGQEPAAVAFTYFEPSGGEAESDSEA